MTSLNPLYSVQSNASKNESINYVSWRVIINHANLVGQLCLMLKFIEKLNVDVDVKINIDESTLSAHFCAKVTKKFQDTVTVKTS